MGNLDPRPVIAAKLDREFMDILLRSGRAQTERLLNEHIPEGQPWTATWHEPDQRGNTLTIQAALPPGLPAESSGEAVHPA